VPGHDLQGILYLRTAEDARLLRAEMQRASSIAIVGGGFIGLEVASTAAALGKKVTILEAGERLLSRAVSPIVADYLRAILRSRLLLNTTVQSIEGQGGRVSHVITASGDRIQADIVLVGIGAEPNTSVARLAGIHCEHAI